MIERFCQYAADMKQKRLQKVRNEFDYLLLTNYKRSVRVCVRERECRCVLFCCCVGCVQVFTASSNAISILNPFACCFVRAHHRHLGMWRLQYHIVSAFVHVFLTFMPFLSLFSSIEIHPFSLTSAYVSFSYQRNLALNSETKDKLPRATDQLKTNKSNTFYMRAHGFC